MKNKGYLKFSLFIIFIFWGSSYVFSQEHCDDSKRYSESEKISAIDIDAASAQTIITQYRERHASDKTIYKTTGFQVSKKVFDNIFDDPDLNTVSIDLVEEGGVLKILVKGIRSDNSGASMERKTGIFKVQSFCPRDCATY